MAQPILQFGTSRFLQAHVDLFVSEALSSGAAIGGITVVQTTSNPKSSARLAALATGSGYRVELRGWRGGKPVQTAQHVDSIREGIHAQREWPRLREEFARDAQVIVSNTGERGYLLDPLDGAASMDSGATAPRSFPA